MTNFRERVNESIGEINDLFLKEIVMPGNNNCYNADALKGMALINSVASTLLDMAEEIDRQHEDMQQLRAYIRTVQDLVLAQDGVIKEMIKES